MADARALTISEPEAVHLLVKACPSFAPRWAELVEGWRVEIGEEDFIAEGTAATELAQHLIARFDAGDSGPVQKIGPSVDAVLRNGDAAARTLIEACFLDELKDSDRYENRSPDDMRAALGPVARNAWENPDQSWRDDVKISFGNWVFIAVFTGLILWLAFWMGCQMEI